MLLKELVKVITDLAISNPIVKATSSGDFDLYYEHSKLFPFVFIEPISMIPTLLGSNNVLLYNFKGYIFDQRNTSGTNIVDIVSQCLEIGRKLNVDLYLAGYSVIVNNYTYVYYLKDEVLSGIDMDFSIYLPYNPNSTDPNC